MDITVCVVMIYQYVPYDYIVEVRNRFKGLYLIDTVPDELWNEVHETGIKTIPMEKKCKKSKWLSGKALQIAVGTGQTKTKGMAPKYSI